MENVVSIYHPAEIVSEKLSWEYTPVRVQNARSEGMRE